MFDGQTPAVIKGVMEMTQNYVTKCYFVQSKIHKNGPVQYPSCFIVGTHHKINR